MHVVIQCNTCQVVCCHCFSSKVEEGDACPNTRSLATELAVLIKETATGCLQPRPAKRPRLQTESAVPLDVDPEMQQLWNMCGKRAHQGAAPASSGPAQIELAEVWIAPRKAISESSSSDEPLSSSEPDSEASLAAAAEAPQGACGVIQLDPVGFLRQGPIPENPAAKGWQPGKDFTPCFCLLTVDLF